MTISLAPDPDTLWNAFTSKHRKNVKRAYKNELLVKSGGIELLPQFYTLMEESWRNLGTPLYSRKYFESVLRTFPDSTRIFVCHRRDEPSPSRSPDISMAWSRACGPAAACCARKLDANYVLYWEMIRDACLRGCRSFHLGRSTRRFRRRRIQAQMERRSAAAVLVFPSSARRRMPALNVDNPKYRLAISAWRRLPLPVTRLIGPPLARLIP